jgi:hypothetical protein
MRDTARIYRKLPLLPQDAGIVLLRPRDEDNQPDITRQFNKEFTVRRWAIRVWLDWLREHHPGYSDVELNLHALDQLSEGDDGAPVDEDVPHDVYDTIPPVDQRGAHAAAGADDTPAEGQLNYDTATVPNVNPEFAAVTDLDRRMRERNANPERRAERRVPGGQYDDNVTDPPDRSPSRSPPGPQ